MMGGLKESRDSCSQLGSCGKEENKNSLDKKPKKMVGITNLPRGGDPSNSQKKKRDLHKNVSDYGKRSIWGGWILEETSRT